MRRKCAVGITDDFGVKMALSMVLICWVSVGLADAPPSTTRQDEHAASGQNDHDAPAYPIVLRISHAALAERAKQQIDRRQNIDRAVLGTRVLGESHTVGRISAQTVTDHNNASFVVNFVGQVQCRMTEYEGPAIIYSRTFTDFACARRVTFDPNRGFVAGPTTMTSTTRLTHDGFASTRRRLVGRVVCRIASREAAANHDESQKIAARNNKLGVREGFERALDEQLSQLNKQLSFGQFVKLLFCQAAQVHVVSCSHADGIYLGIGQNGKATPFSIAGLARPASMPVELWIHSNLLGEEPTKLVELIGSERSEMLSSSAQRMIQRALPVSLAEPRTMELLAIDSWVVVALQK
jgi:hypothetical protein